jgi:hypothetical protein
LWHEPQLVPIRLVSAKVVPSGSAPEKPEMPPPKTPSRERN